MRTTLKQLLIGAIVGVIVLWALNAYAQERVANGTKFGVAASHDGLNTTTYRLYRNDVVVQSKPVSALESGQIAFDETPAVGSYVYKISAVRTDPALPGGEIEAKSLDSLAVIVYDPTPPAPPSGVRIIRLVASIAPDGTITFRIVEE